MIHFHIKLSIYLISSNLAVRPSRLLFDTPSLIIPRLYQTLIRRYNIKLVTFGLIVIINELFLEELSCQHKYLIAIIYVHTYIECLIDSHQFSYMSILWCEYNVFLDVLSCCFVCFISLTSCLLHAHTSFICFSLHSCIASIYFLYYSWIKC